MNMHGYAGTLRARLIEEIKENTETCRRLEIMTSTFISKTQITPSAHSLSSPTEQAKLLITEMPLP